MGIRRYFASKDNTITNAFQPNLITRGTGSNMGASDILEVFSIYAQANTSSYEAARTLIQFSTTNIISDRNAEKIPISGNVNFFLKLTNAEHPYTVPEQFTVNILPISQSWEEGTGLDMEDFSDLVKGGAGSNWIFARQGTQWTTQGGDFLSSPIFTQSFDSGIEDLEIDITSLVEQWIDGSITNNGIGIFLSGTFESGSSRSYYTKRFFGRGTEFFFRRPIIEARFNDALKDDRGKFILSSSLLSADENNNTIYLYNIFNKRLRNIPSVGTGSIFVNIFPSASNGTAINNTVITGGYVSTGIYSATVALTTNEEIVFDRWFSGSSVFHTGVIEPISFNASSLAQTTLSYVTNISNLKAQYTIDELGRFRLFTRAKNWSPTIFTIANQNIENTIIDNAYFKVFRIVDGLDVIPYGTGTIKETLMSYDVSGNYFDIPMELLEPDYSYGIKVLFQFENDFEEQPNVFKFRVDKNL